MEEGVRRREGKRKLREGIHGGRGRYMEDTRCRGEGKYREGKIWIEMEVDGREAQGSER